MHKLYEIRDGLMRELEDYAGQNMHNVETVKCVHILTDAIKNIDKIAMLGSGQSQRMSHDGYSNGYSSDGHSGYSRDGYSERRYSRRGKDHVLDTLSGLMDSADQHERGIIERAMRQLKEL